MLTMLGEAIAWARPHALDLTVGILAFTAGWAAAVSWRHWDDP